MVTAALPAEQQLAASRCASCPKMCRGVCPTLEVTRNERHQPWGHAHEDVAAQRSAVAGGEGFAGPAVAESAYVCATCAACTVPCEVEGVETPELVWAVRAAVWASGSAPAAAVEAAGRAADGYVPSDEVPVGWVNPAPVIEELAALSTPDATSLLLPGCGALGRRPRAAVAAGRALRVLGVAFRVAPEHRCCGAIALAAGDAGGARQAAAALADATADRVIAQSPSCAAHLSRAGVAVVPLIEVLAGALASRPGPPTSGSRAAYHDPCMLARHLGTTGAARAALRATGTEVLELAHHGRATRCSGRGGLLSMTHPDIARGYLELLAGDVRASGAERVVSGCASCATALEQALPGVEVLELAEAIAAAALEERP